MLVWIQAGRLLDVGYLRDSESSPVCVRRARNVGSDAYRSADVDEGGFVA